MNCWQPMTAPRPRGALPWRMALDLDLARFYVAIALGESPGDVVTEAAPGSNAVVALPQPPEERP
jgi:hypothetical protein